ncbi:ester cyclase [Paenalcaligenes sp. Me131]|uniref:ester cyclase n=1 Tax=Paenalcaligenes sp. Me131 TaxID=3392636 RepID=UPI003D2B8DB3
MFLNSAPAQRSERYAHTIRSLFYLLVGLCFCSLVRANEPPPTASQAPWPVVQAYIDGWNAHDITQALDATAPNLHYFNTSIGVAEQGHETLRKVLTGLVGLLPDLQWKVIDVPTIESNTVAFEWEVSGTASLSAPHNATVIRPISLRGASVIKVAQDRIVYIADYYNAQDMQQQLAH